MIHPSFLPSLPPLFSFFPFQVVFLCDMLISVGICPRHKHFWKYVLWASPEIFTYFAYFFDALHLSVTAVWFIVASFYFIIKCCSSFHQLTLLFSLSYLLSWLSGALKCARCPKAWTTAEPLGWPGCLAEAPRACCCVVSLVQVCLVEGYSFPLPSMHDCSSALSESSDAPTFSCSNWYYQLN